MENSSEVENLFNVPKSILRPELERKIIHVRAIFTLVKVTSLQYEGLLENEEYSNLIADASELGESLCMDIIDSDS